MNFSYPINHAIGQYYETMLRKLSSFMVHHSHQNFIRINPSLFHESCFNALVHTIGHEHYVLTVGSDRYHFNVRVTRSRLLLAMPEWVREGGRDGDFIRAMVEEIAILL